jgi:hypothetical protein
MYTFIVKFLKKKRAKQGVSILVKKRYITTWEAINENMIKLHMNLFGKKLCILRIYAISEDESILVKEDFFGKLPYFPAYSAYLTYNAHPKLFCIPFEAQITCT